MTTDTATTEAHCNIYTIGHSTHTLEELTAMLKAHGVDTLADIRTIPRSRHNPQFNADALGKALKPYGIRYLPLQALGGLRHVQKDSPNGGWRNKSFQGYADYMQTPEFAAALDALIDESKKHTMAIMCAESVPWRCHRSLVSDALLVRGVQACHIMSQTNAPPHRLTKFAQVKGKRITYPPEQASLI